jgi:hypothetical protein
MVCQLIIRDWRMNTNPVIIRVINRQRERMLNHHWFLIKQIYNCSRVGGHKKTDITVCFWFVYDDEFGRQT